jgi:hypothetical protein
MSLLRRLSSSQRQILIIIINNKTPNSSNLISLKRTGKTWKKFLIDIAPEENTLLSGTDCRVAIAPRNDIEFCPVISNPFIISGEKSNTLIYNDRRRISIGIDRISESNHHAFKYMEGKWVYQ